MTPGLEQMARQGMMGRPRTTKGGDHTPYLSFETVTTPVMPGG